jgi:hypothetical protein
VGVGYDDASKMELQSTRKQSEFMSNQGPQHKRLLGVKAAGYLNYCFHSWPTLHQGGPFESRHTKRAEMCLARAHDGNDTSKKP